MEGEELSRLLNKAHKLACQATGVLAQQIAKRRLHRGYTAQAIEDLESAKKELQSLIAATVPKK